MAGLLVSSVYYADPSHPLHEFDGKLLAVEEKARAGSSSRPAAATCPCPFWPRFPVRTGGGGSSSRAWTGTRHGRSGRRPLRRPVPRRPVGRLATRRRSRGSCARAGCRRGRPFWSRRSPTCSRGRLGRSRAGKRLQRGGGACASREALKLTHIDGTAPADVEALPRTRHPVWARLEAASLAFPAGQTPANVVPVAQWPAGRLILGRTAARMLLGHEGLANRVTAKLQAVREGRACPRWGVGLRWGRTRSRRTISWPASRLGFPRTAGTCTSWSPTSRSPSRATSQRRRPPDGTLKPRAQAVLLNVARRGARCVGGGVLERTARQGQQETGVGRVVDG